jgi:hypothetical protein
MRQLVHLLLVLIGFGAMAGSTAAAPQDQVRQVFLVQNSGWMEPFYTDPNSPLRPFLNRLASGANLRGVDVVIASFNQDGQVAGRRSPEVRYEGPYDAARVRAAVDAIDLPRKASGAYADADFQGALRGTMERVLGGGQGVIWLVTNNKDAPDNSQAVVANTEAFYQILRQNPAITAVAAFPMRREVTGPNFRERGLIFYAIAVGPRGRAALDAILKDGAPARALFPAPPVRLKPLTENPVELLLNSETAEVTAEVRGGRLLVSGVPSSGGIVRLRGRLRNSFYPQNIAEARMSAEWRAHSPELAGAQARMRPETITNVPADGLSGPVQLELRLPEIPRASGIAGWFEEERVVMGELEVKLESIDFTLDRGFVSRLSAITGTGALQAEQAEAAMSANLPPVFMDYQRVSSSAMRVPVQINVKYSAWPLILLILFGLLLLLALIVLFIKATRAKAHDVMIGRHRQRVTVKPFEKKLVTNIDGASAQVRGSLFGAPSVRQIEQEGRP